MEILAEILFGLLGCVAEIVLQVLFEALAEFGLRAVTEPFKTRREAEPWLALLGYAIFGTVVGGLSLLVVPASFLQSFWARSLNLVVSPLAAGLAMSVIGAWRRGRGEELIRLDRFSYGLVFALAMALVRYFFAVPG